MLLNFVLMSYESLTKYSIFIFNHLSNHLAFFIVIFFVQVIYVFISLDFWESHGTEGRDSGCTSRPRDLEVWYPQKENTNCTPKATSKF